MTDRAPIAIEAAGEAARLRELADEAWDRRMATHPVEATSLGDRRFDDRLRPNGPGVLEAEAEALDASFRRTRAIDPATLSPEDRLTRAALIDFLAADLAIVEAGVEAWAVDPLDGPQVEFLNIPSFQLVRDRDEADALIRRWHEMAPWIDRHIATARDALQRRIGAPAALVRSVVAELDDLLERSPEDWPVAAPIASSTTELDATESDRAAIELRSIIADEIRPAFGRYRSFLVEELGPVARGDDRPGLGALPGGDAAYERLVRAHTTLDLRPEDIHRIGLEETARIDAEFEALGTRLLGTSDRGAVIARLRSDPDLRFQTSAEIHAVAEASLARANAAIPGWFGRLPHAPCVVVEMAEHEARHSTLAYYRDPAADGSRPGSYYVNTTEPETRPRYEAEVLAFHEAVPGHHLQIAIAQELEGLPAFRRMAGATAYVEGWGLYSERLSQEMGLLSGDMDGFGVLSFDAWRACRLVVDTGLHALGWSRSAAIDFMLDHTALGENNVVNEVDRYLAIPGQALAYKLGQLELLQLREEARTSLGTAFDVRAFHDVVLGQGAVGLGVLRGVVEAWLDERRGAGAG